MDVKVSWKGLEQLERDLKTMRRKAIPHAARNALNDTAFAARKVWQAEMSKEFTLRNKFTANSVRVDKAQGYNIDTMKAVVGSTADYMEDLEHGKSYGKKGEHGVPISTSAASGEGRSAKRRRPVKNRNKLDEIKLGPRIKGSRHVRVAGTIAHAQRTGRKYVFLELGKRGHRKGIFRLSGGKRRTRLDMVWDLSRSSVRVRPHPTLEPAFETANRWAPGIHRRALVAQFRRAGLRSWVR